MRNGRYIADYHMHSSCSFDGKYTMAEMVKAAVEAGADALDVVELIYALETEFEMRIPLKESEALPTARSVIAWLAEQRR